MRKIDWDSYLFRCHSYGKIMGGAPKGLTTRQAETLQSLEDRNAGVGKALTDKQRDQLGILRQKKKEAESPKLTDAAKKFLGEIHQQATWGRYHNINSKYMEKGIRVEERAITLYTEVTGEFWEKNEERKKNGFFTGVCDSYNAKRKLVPDIKSSWDWRTFPHREAGITNELYAWQLDGYMSLWDADSAMLVYCLVDTPFDIVNREINKADHFHDIFDHNGIVKDEKVKLVKQIVTDHIYTREQFYANGDRRDDCGLTQYIKQSGFLMTEWFEDFVEIPAQERVRAFGMERSAHRENQAKEMIAMAREYLKSLD